MTSCPPSLRSKAATEESTPPDMATAMRILRLYVSRHSGGGTREASRSAFPLPPPASRFPALHLTSLLDDTGNDVDRSLDLFECGEAGERETDDTLRLRGRKTQRKDGGRRGQCSARAGAPDRDRNALEVESGEQSLPRKTLEEKRRRVRQAGRPPSDYTSPLETFQNSLLELVAQARDPDRLTESLAGQPGRDTESHDPGRVLGAGAKLLLLSSALCARLEWKSIADVERSDALGAMKLVGRKAQQIHIPCLDIDRDPARGLNRVRVEEGAAPVNCGGQTGDREETAVLVVGGHDRDEERRRGERLLHARGIQSTGGLRVHDSRLDPLAAKRVHRLPHRRMLGTRPNGMSAPAGRGAEDRHGIGLGASRGEEDLFGRGPDEAGRFF